MNFAIKEFSPDNIKEALAIWNSVIENGTVFPQEYCLNTTSGLSFFNSQSYTGLAYNVDTNEIVGVYILHPNNVGRCGHICNASYAVKEGLRGQRIGEALVLHSLLQGKQLHFKILQFNAVVSSNTAALRLYEKLGFVQLGVIPNGFLRKDGHYEDIIPHYITL